MQLSEPFHLRENDPRGDPDVDGYPVGEAPAIRSRWTARRGGGERGGVGEVDHVSGIIEEEG